MENVFPSISQARIVESRSVLTHYHHFFRIHWILGRYCNYSCSYCWPSSHSPHKDPVREESYYIQGLQQIAQQASGNGFRNLLMTLSGGEPTLHPHFLTVVAALGAYRSTETAAALVVVTNLSRGRRWLDEFVSAGQSLNYIDVVASWHREFGDLEKFKQRALHLAEQGVNVEINVTFAASMFDDYLNDALYLKDAGLTVKALPERSARQKPYSQAQQAMLEQEWGNTHAHASRHYFHPLPTHPQPLPPAAEGFGMELIDQAGNAHYVDFADRYPALGITQFQHWQCYSGYQNICIEADGSLRRGKGGCRNELIGNLFAPGGPVIHTTPQICQQTVCDCATDLITTKRQLNHPTLGKTRIPVYPTSAPRHSP